MTVRFGRRRLRSLGDFAREIAIIVVGVLIALAASEYAEERNWAQRVEDAERQLGLEASQNFLYAAEAFATEPCVQTQLATLRKRVLASGDRLVPAPVHEDAFMSFVLRVPVRPYGNAIWDALGADGTAAHFDDQRSARYAENGAQLANLRRMTAEAELVVGRLRVLGSDVPLDAATRVRLLEAIDEQAYRTRLQSVMALQVMAALRDLGHAGDQAAVAHDLAGASGTLQFCQAQGLPLADWRATLAKVPAR